MLYILGQMVARTNEGANSALHIFKPVSANLDTKTDNIEATGFPFDESEIQILDSANIKETTTLTVSQESLDELDLQMLLDQREQTTPTIALPTIVKVTVPSVTPFEVAIAGLTANQDVVATVLSDTNPIYLKRVTAAPAAIGEFQVTAGKLVFHSGAAGLSVVVWSTKTETALLVIGGTNPDTSYGEMSFSGILKGTRQRKRLYIPRIVRTGDKKLGVSSKVETAEMQYKCLTPSGWSKPYVMWDA
jgi:hypothetical protein